MGISRACASKWVNRFRAHGKAGLHDRSSAPHRQPTATSAEVVDLIEAWRRERKWSARRIAHELERRDAPVSVRTVSRTLERLGLNRRRFLDPAGESNRVPGRIHARWPGHMVHVDIKKVGRIPDGGGWRAHGRGSAQALAGDLAKAAGARRGCTCTPRWTGSPGSPTPNTYPTRRPPRRPRSGNGPTASSPPTASRRSTASSPTTAPATAPPNSLAASATAVTSASPRTPHATTGRSSGTTGSSPRSSTCARCYGSEDERRQALAVWNCHYNYHRPHTATGNQPPASKVRHHVINVMASYS